MLELDVKALFKKRLNGHLKELNRYFRYIFNGHIAFALMFFIAASAYYYRAWLADLPPHFPAALTLGVIFGVVVSMSPVRTFLREPDLVFLLVAEKKLSPYFLGTYLYSFISQLYLVILSAAVLGPLYMAAYPGRGGRTYLFMILVLVIFKAWNMLAHWWALSLRDQALRQLEFVLRLLLNIAVFYFFAKGSMLFAGTATILFALLFLAGYSLAKKQAGLYWELLVEKHEHSMQAFYRFANLFADVPHLKNKVKRRNWLLTLFPDVPFEKTASYDYLYKHTFVRSGDYAGIYMRLTVIGALAVWFVPNEVVRVLFALLFLYMTTFQLMPLYQHHRTVIWLDLYPVQVGERRKAVLKLMFKLAVLQTVLFSLLFFALGLWQAGLIVLAAGLVFSYWFIFVYANRKMQKESLAG